MLLSCILMTNRGTTPTAFADDVAHVQTASANEVDTVGGASGADGVGPKGGNRDDYAVTCYICVNVSDNDICNQYAIDRPCKPGETFCHTLHIMDSKGTSVLVNKKCTGAKECQRNKVGCVEIDTQLMCVSCCDQDYCNVNIPSNASTAIYDDKITKMRSLAKNLFNTEREKALTTTIKSASAVRPLTGGGWRATLTAALTILTMLGNT